MSLMGRMWERAKSSVGEHLHGNILAGAANGTGGSQGAFKCDILTAMKDEAARQGWLEEEDLGYLAELEWSLKNAAQEGAAAINRTPLAMREHRILETCRYLFARTVEGVILWGQSPDGHIDFDLNIKHLDDLATITAPHLRELVVQSADVGESLYQAQHTHLEACRAAAIPFDARAEMARVVRYIPRFAIRYAMHNKYNEPS